MSAHVSSLASGLADCWTQRERSSPSLLAPTRLSRPAAAPALFPLGVRASLHRRLVGPRIVTPFLLRPHCSAGSLRPTRVSFNSMSLECVPPARETRMEGSAGRRARYQGQWSPPRSRSRVHPSAQGERADGGRRQSALRVSSLCRPRQELGNKRKSYGLDFRKTEV